MAASAVSRSKVSVKDMQNALLARSTGDSSEQLQVKPSPATKPILSQKPALDQTAAHSPATKPILSQKPALDPTVASTTASSNRSGMTARVREFGANKSDQSVSLRAADTGQGKPIGQLKNPAAAGKQLNASNISNQKAMGQRQNADKFGSSIEKTAVSQTTTTTHTTKPSLSPLKTTQNLTSQNESINTTPTQLSETEKPNKLPNRLQSPFFDSEKESVNKYFRPQSMVNSKNESISPALKLKRTSVESPTQTSPNAESYRLTSQNKTTSSFMKTSPDVKSQCLKPQNNSTTSPAKTDDDGEYNNTKQSPRSTRNVSNANKIVQSSEKGKSWLFRQKEMQECKDSVDKEKNDARSKDETIPETVQSEEKEQPNGKMLSKPDQLVERHKSWLFRQKELAEEKKNTSEVLNKIEVNTSNSLETNQPVYKLLKLPDRLKGNAPRKPAKPPNVNLSQFLQEVDDDIVYELETYVNEDDSNSVGSSARRPLSTISNISEYTEEEEERLLKSKQAQRQESEEFYDDVAATQPSEDVYQNEDEIYAEID